MPLKEKLQSLLSNKWSWILVAFLLGLDLGWQAHRWMNGGGGISSPFQFKFHRGFNIQDGSEVEGSEADPQDPFENMREMQEKMLRQFGGLGGSGGFSGQGQAFEMDSGDFKEREDDRFVYYDLDFKGQTPENLQVKVEDGQISVSGRLEMKTETSGGGSVVSSSFHRSFPVPDNVIAEKFEIEQEGGKIVIKFPKR